MPLAPLLHSHLHELLRPPPVMRMPQCALSPTLIHIPRRGTHVGCAASVPPTHPPNTPSHHRCSGVYYFMCITNAPCCYTVRTPMRPPLDTHAHDLRSPLVTHPLRPHTALQPLLRPHTAPSSFSCKVPTPHAVGLWLIHNPVASALSAHPNVVDTQPSTLGSVRTSHHQLVHNPCSRPHTPPSRYCTIQ